MLLSAVITLELTRNAELPANLGRASHAWFLAQVEEHDSAIAERLHRPNEQRPFTVSNLYDAGQPRRGRIAVSPGQRGKIRLSSYDRDLSDLMAREFLPKLPDTIRLAHHPFKIVDVCLEQDGDPWSGYCDFQPLMQEQMLADQLSGSFTLRFASPTVFKSRGHFMPLPLPRLVFEGLGRRWNGFSPVPVPDEIGQYADECLVISRYRLQTERVAFGDDGSRGAFPGFMGTCSYSFREQDRYWKGLIHLLASFALYAGVGMQTTMGLGQVRKL